MEDTQLILKSLADDTRLEIVKLLLSRKYCVGALARRLSLTEAAISQHLKVLREAGLLDGEKNGRFMHYEVNRDKLKELASAIERLAAIQSEPCEPENENCQQKKRHMCHKQIENERCADEVRHACLGHEGGELGHCCHNHGSKEET